jgi:Glycosyl hydrolases family 43
VPADHRGRETVWAPEVHHYEGRYYLFVTLTSSQPLSTPPGRPPNVRRGTEILVADRPVGPFTPLGRGSMTPRDWMALDGTFVLEDGVESFQGHRYHASITDGPWLHRTKTGRLAGPWVHHPEPLWRDDGGHPMLFRTFDDRLVMAIHQRTDASSARGSSKWTTAATG